MFRRLFQITIVGLALSSCSELETVVLNPDAAIAPTISATSVVLIEDNVGNDALTISWTAPEYGFTASPTYFIYFDVEGGDFSAPIAVNVGTNLTKTFKVEELNKHLINLGFEPEIQTGLDIKVISRLTNDLTIDSEVTTIDATAFSSFLDLSTSWGVVGSGYNNWGSFPDAPFFTTGTPGVIVAYATLLDGEIKFRENNEWTNNVGDDGADGTLETNGANIAVTAGTYKITYNTNTNTYSIVEYYWGIVGSAYNNWGADGPDFKFTYDDATDQWRAIVTLLAGDFKIRKNDTWGGDYGDATDDGILDQDADNNITVEAGKYIVTFSESDLSYSIEPIDHIWGLVGSAYNDWGNDGPDAAFGRDWRNDDIWVLDGVNLLAGAWKVRDGNDWTLNYGDTGADGTLEEGGSDIVSTAGYWKVILDFSVSPPTYTATKYP